MSRLRATLAKSEVDRQVQSEVATAYSAVERALRACRHAQVGPGVSRSRLNRVSRDLARVKDALGNVGRVTPLHDADDPDLESEDDRAAAWRERLDAERRAAPAPTSPPDESGD